MTIADVPLSPRPCDTQVYVRARGVSGVRLYFFDRPERVDRFPHGLRITYHAGGIVEVYCHRLLWIEPERH